MYKRGFTLIEVLALILLVGALAFVALPNFVNLKRPAQLSSLQNMEATLRSASVLVSSKALLEGKDTEITLDDGTSIELYAGYPTADWLNSVRYLISLDSEFYTRLNAPACEKMWCGVGNRPSIPGIGAVSGAGAKIWPKGYTWGQQCGVYFINRENGEPPEIGLTSRDC
ncbi:type II secretion system protein [Agaribacterium sp. ZY112]|uniref:type II secretion system protein n=1 Tax=Agaribacterium sp. ZY112 TaxID=3233574 RepID=UPI0035261627